MKLFLKFFVMAVVLSLFIIIIYMCFEDVVAVWMDQNKMISFFEKTRPFAWFLGIALLVSDIFLPVPATVIFTALGAVYGVLLGTLFGATGSCLAGLLGYGIAKWLGPKGMFISEKELKKAQIFFNRWGGVAVILSRSLPIFPEVISLLAGLAHMRFFPFLMALIIGSFPVAGLFAYLGCLARSMPKYGLWLVMLAALVLWLIAAFIIKRLEISKKEKVENA